MRYARLSRLAGLGTLGACLALGFGSPAFADDYRAVPGLSAKDRALLAASMVQQGQCRNALVEIQEAAKEMADDEALIRLRGTCQAEMMAPEAKETILKWLQMATQNHPERGKMLSLLAKSQAPAEVSYEWVPVPAGEFEMGAEGGAAEADEAPKHKVTLDAYLIGKYEVTNKQYHMFVKATGHRLPQNCCEPKYTSWKGDAPIEGTAELPIINVSWDDAVAFCKWVGGRLPTEAEWEKAARGTDGRLYPWGNESPMSGNRANFSFEPISVWEGPASLAKKDQYEHGKSPYGAYEMAGNVWEWTGDWYDEAYYKTSPAKNPTGPANGKARVLRGGSWRNNVDTLRASNRNGKHLPEERRVYLGIRCAKDAGK
jgi:formylglycine-generating enzyme required for sulfatase activity